MLKSVMCVDDDPVTLMICKVVLETSNFTQNVVTAENGKLAIDLLTSDADAPGLSLILLDLNMPVMDGWGFLDEFTSKHVESFPNLKIIILSSSVNPEDFKRAKNHKSVIDYIQKPLTVELIEEIKHSPHFFPFFEKTKVISQRS
ncbi:MAG: response regulator [Imperialibacter sp.]|uniref:response regulator n=1 Tax=Imperialibacter sp. TaxID=2038411 RepID=UPI003A8C4CBA